MPPKASPPEPAPLSERDASMTTRKCRPVRSCSPIASLPRLVLLPALHADADSRPALLPQQPRAVPVIFGSISAALAELRRLRDAYAKGGRA